MSAPPNSCIKPRHALLSEQYTRVPDAGVPPQPPELCSIRSRASERFIGCADAELAENAANASNKSAEIRGIFVKEPPRYRSVRAPVKARLSALFSSKCVWRGPPKW